MTESMERWAMRVGAAAVAAIVLAVPSNRAAADASAQCLCEQTGGTWDPLSCGHYVCGIRPLCEAIIPGCDCGPGRIFVEGRGCVEDPVCKDFCAADLDGDFFVGFSDLSSLLSEWGFCDDCEEDLDQDGNVGFTDLTMLLAMWGPCL